MENLRAVLFDFEGTLVDFQWNLKGAELELAQERVKLQFTPDDFAQIEGYDISSTGPCNKCGSEINQQGSSLFWPRKTIRYIYNPKRCSVL